MATLTTQRPGKKISPLGMGILLVGGCIPGYQDTPIPPCFFADDPDPACQMGQGHDGSGTGGGVPTTGTAFPGDGSGADDSEGQGPSDGTDTSEVDVETTTGSGGSETSGSAVEPVPEIVDLDLDPDAPKSAGPVKVIVQAENAVEVWMTVDDGGEVALEPIGDDGTEFVGEIAVLGESWNGLHTVSAVAHAGELESSPWDAMFTVTAPAAGSEVWKKKSSITPSFGNAVAVDFQGDVYELFTEWGNQGMRCHVRRRDTLGEAVWPQDAVALADGVDCIGEDIKTAPDGTVWVLVNTVVDTVDRWQLFSLSPDGVLLDDPEISDFEEVGRGLDVNAAGDLLLCGTRPGVESSDAWVKLTPQVGKGWTVPWVNETVVNQNYDERTRDCGFVEDRIVVVGEAFGVHDPNDVDKFSRGFVVEFGVNGVELFEAVATDIPTQQSGYEAVAPDAGGYAAVGYTCDTQDVPCSPKQGVVKWFSWGASLTWEQAVTNAVTVSDVVASASGGVVVAAQALEKEQGFLVQAWASGQGASLWDYQGTLSTAQVANGIALGPYGYLSAGGYYLDGDTLAAGVVTLHPF